MIPAIIDTDIGSDIDDTWALAMALRCPELDVQLVSTASGDTAGRARIAGRLLTVAGRSDIPLAAGAPGDDIALPQRDFGNGYALVEHGGGFRHDGARAIVDAVMSNAEPVTIIALGPLTNLADALSIEPSIANRARVVAMLGSLRVGYRGGPGPVAEYNVAADVDACRLVLAAPWSITATPLDTCGSTRLLGERYAALWTKPDPLLDAVRDNYRLWLESADRLDLLDVRSSTLFDTVAIYLAYDESLVEIEDVRITIDDEGVMREGNAGRPIRLATRWRDEDAFLDHLLGRLRGTP